MSTITIGVGSPKSVFSVREVGRFEPCAAPARATSWVAWSVARPAARRQRGGDGVVQRSARLGTALPGVWPAARAHRCEVCHAVPQGPQDQGRSRRCRGIATAARQGNVRFVPVRKSGSAHLALMAVTTASPLTDARY